MMMTLRTLLNVGFMMFMLMVIFKARHHSSITGKYTASANRGNIYISTEHSINHLQSKINDKKAYIKNFKMFVVVVTVHKND